MVVLTINQGFAIKWRSFKITQNIVSNFDKAISFHNLLIVLVCLYTNKVSYIFGRIKLI